MEFTVLYREKSRLLKHEVSLLPHKNVELKNMIEPLFMVNDSHSLQISSPALQRAMWWVQGPVQQHKGIHTSPEPWRWCHSLRAGRTHLWTPGKGSAMTQATLTACPASWTLSTPPAHQTSGSQGTELPGLTPHVRSNSCRMRRPRCSQWWTERATLRPNLPWELHPCLLGTPWWRHHCRRAPWTPWAAPLPGAQLAMAVTPLLPRRKSGQCSQDAVLTRLSSPAPSLYPVPHVLRMAGLFSSLPSWQLLLMQVTLVWTSTLPVWSHTCSCLGLRLSVPHEEKATGFPGCSPARAPAQFLTSLAQPLGGSQLMESRISFLLSLQENSVNNQCQLSS